MILTNLTLRPLAYKFRPGLSEKAAEYCVDLICNDSDESHFRALVVGDLGRNGLTLRAITREQHPLGGQITLRAELSSSHRRDECVEQLVSRLSLDRAVDSVRWCIGVPAPPAETTSV